MPTFVTASTRIFATEWIRHTSTWETICAIVKRSTSEWTLTDSGDNDYSKPCIQTNFISEGVNWKVTVEGDYCRFTCLDVDVSEQILLAWKGTRIYAQRVQNLKGIVAVVIERQSYQTVEGTIYLDLGLITTEFTRQPLSTANLMILDVDQMFAVHQEAAADERVRLEMEAEFAAEEPEPSPFTNDESDDDVEIIYSNVQ